MTQRPLILASSSPYRRQLLEKLGLPFNSISADIDESPLPDEQPADLVTRLAQEKAATVAALPSTPTGSLIIASDQVATLGECILTKPHTHTRAIEQLTQSSGQVVHFNTSLCLLDTQQGALQPQQLLADTFSVHFRTLTHKQIEAYLNKEQPYDCAGSFKSEGLGIALFKKLQGDDPNSLVGLPLIKLVEFLSNAGVEILE